ncbi:adenine-specific DNA-methyltransferase [Nitrosospira multiformis]|nr:adenine-specific DNA-methyltransferase [Nitrosospira multiformis]
MGGLLCMWETELNQCFKQRKLSKQKSFMLSAVGDAGATLAEVEKSPTLLARAQFRQRPYPHYIKYMGSKSKIMDFVLSGINEVYEGGPLCDLFGGSASLAGAVGDQVAVHSNDIQCYSAVLARAYLTSWRAESSPTSASIIAQAKVIVETSRQSLDCLHDYAAPVSLEKFNGVEREQQALLDRNFSHPWHLFLKYYSGTWWSAEQALWIDAIREVADRYKDDPCYDVILSSLMFAIAYASQGTGHYAQYRDANTESSMRDISIYRKRSVAQLFAKKYDSVLSDLQTEPAIYPHKVTTLDFRACLAECSGGTVYADPPYAFVHYSRFYHALETLVLYDYPDIQEKKGVVVKGRYREDRHQSPFCIRSLVKGAFEELFRGVRESGSNLVLSYSNTGMISLDDLGDLATREFSGRSVEIVFTDYKHMTLGRQFDRHREVEECLILVK